MRLNMNGATVLLLAGLLAGCSSSPAPTQSKDEEQVRQTFTALQEALKAKDGDKLWALLDSDSQADAERAARTVADAYGKATPDARAEQEATLGLPGAQLSSLKGQGFLTTKRFLGKYDEVPESKIDAVSVKGDQATVTFVEPDGDKEKLSLVRQTGQWKVSLPMPKGGQ